MLIGLPFGVFQPGADFDRAPKYMSNRISHLRDTNCYFPQRWDSTASASQETMCEDYPTNRVSEA